MDDLGQPKRCDDCGGQSWFDANSGDWACGCRKEQTMTLELYHGRETLDEDMNEWGSVGPALLLDSVTVTYGADIRIRFTGQDDWENLEEYMIGDCFFYNNVHYGDWSIQDSQKSKESGLTPELFRAELLAGGRDEQ